MKKLLYLLAMILIFYGCPKTTPTAPDVPEQKNPPTISSFAANPSKIFPGNKSTLSWNVMGAITVGIDQEIGTVANSGSQEVRPTETIIYTLTATNNDGTVTKTCQITINSNLPNIEEFKVTPSSVNYGDSSDLYWDISNATKVEIDQGIGIVGQNIDPVQGIQKVSPTKSTIYTLTATNNEGQVTDTCTLTVRFMANVIMTDGPTYTYYPGFFTVSGIIKNIGYLEARGIHMWVIIKDFAGNICLGNDIYSLGNLSSNQSLSWHTDFYDLNVIRDIMDESKTGISIFWDE